MKEIEVKLIGLDRDQLKAKLEAQGAVRVQSEFQTNYVIDSAERPLQNGDYLRIRRVEVDGQVQTREFTYKRRLNEAADGQPAKSRINEEYTVHIDSEEGLLQILDLLGYQLVSCGQKKRDHYQYGDLIIDFDEWDPATLSYPYVEVEAPSEEALYAFLEAFAIPKEVISTKSISQLQAEDREA